MSRPLIGRCENGFAFLIKLCIYESVQLLWLGFDWIDGVKSIFVRRPTIGPITIFFQLLTSWGPINFLFLLAFLDQYDLLITQTKLHLWTIRSKINVLLHTSNVLSIKLFKIVCFIPSFQPFSLRLTGSTIFIKYQTLQYCKPELKSLQRRG